MATVLLSIATNTFRGICMSIHLGPLTRRLVHPTAPVLLTKSGPLGTHINRQSFINDQFASKLGISPI